jgi:UDP-N-acetylmuramate--alanine ligase
LFFYTRVRDLFEGFLSCFNEADELVITDIYAAGEPSIEGVSSAALYTRLREKLGQKVRFIARSHLESGVASLAQPLDVVLTTGAGDVTSVGPLVLEKIKHSPPRLSVGILFGGVSPEHEISIMSARNIISELDAQCYHVRLFGIAKDGTWFTGDNAFDAIAQKSIRLKRLCKMAPAVLEELGRCDLCIPLFQGFREEGGMIQGFLDTLNIPYVGCDYQASAICMHKAWTKHAAAVHGIPVSNYVEYSLAAWRNSVGGLCDLVARRLHYPVLVKPVHLGSGVGVGRAANESELNECAARAFQYDDAILVEEQIIGRRIEFALLGNDFIQIGAPSEILDHGPFYDREKKHDFPATQIQSPADMTELQIRQGRELAQKMYEVCGCKGLARIEFFLDAEGRYWLNEIDPFPRFTADSLYPKMWEAEGISQQDLCNELITLALQRYRRLIGMRRE